MRSAAESAAQIEDELPMLLREGETCSELARAERATLLIDGEEYFAALRTALLKARRQILIAGWDFDTRAPLPPCSPSEVSELCTAPAQLGELLGYLIRTRPGLEIHVLRWDYHLIYWKDRELDTRNRLTQLGVRFHSDCAHPMTGCVHHKIVVIDDALAFCGGVDLTHKRWDSSRHDPADPRRLDPDGDPYMPVHDTQMCVSGPIAHRLGEYVRDCWSISAGACPAVVDPPADLWPDGVRVDFRGARMAISRTLPPRAGRPAVREIEALYLKAIKATQQELYFENQYFTSTRIAHAIARQCQDKPQLQGLLVGCMKPKTWIECHTMGYGRARFNEVLESSGVAQRVPLVAALNRAGEGINVHSKLAIFDDRLLTVGSANLNQRSMGFDVECNLSLEACTETERQKIRALRNQLLGEHLSLSSEEVPSAIQTHGLANLPHAIQGQRRLAPVSISEYKRTLGPVLVPFFDRQEQWSTPSLPAPSSASVRWQHAFMVGIVALAGGALGYSLFGDDQTTLASLQKIIELFDSG